MDARAGTFWDRRYTAFIVVAVLFAGGLFLARLGERSLWSEEVRWAQIPREMIQSGDYFRPTINGHTYYDKPLGSYWLVLAFAGGGDVSEFAARLPCAMAGVLSVLLVTLIARRLYDGLTGNLAGACLATSFSIVFFSRHASADMENVAGILAVLWLYHRWEDHPVGWRTVVLWLVMAITSLTKGLLGFAVPMLVLGVYRLFGPLKWRDLVDRQRWVLNRWTLLAAPSATALYLAPFYVSYSRTGATDGLSMVFRENLRRFFDPVNHRGPVWLYIVAIFPLLAPWSVLMPAALWHAHSHWRADDQRRRFALIYFWSTFVFFTLSASRRSYYLLPALPAAAMLIARLLSESAVLQTRWTRWLTMGGVIAVVFGLLAVSTAMMLPTPMRPAPWDQWPALPTPVFAVIFAMVAVHAIWILVRFRGTQVGGSMLLSALAMTIYVFLFAMPSFEQYRTRKPFADSVRQYLHDNLRGLALHRHREVVYYLASPEPLPEFDAMDSLAKAVADGTIRWLILRGADVRNVSSPSRIVVEEKIWPWESAEQVHAKLVLIEFTHE